MIIDKYQMIIAKIEPNVPGAKGMKPIPKIVTKYFSNIIYFLYINTVVNTAIPSSLPV